LAVRPRITASLIVSCPRPTSSAGGSWLASSPNNMAAVAPPCWRASPVSPRTPSAVVGANYGSTTWPRRAGSVGRGPGARPWKPTTQNREGPGGVVEGRHGRRSDLRPEVDTPLPEQSPQGPEAPWPEAGTRHDRPAVAPGEVLAADQPQAVGGDPRSAARPAVPLPEAPAAAVHHA